MEHNSSRSTCSPQDTKRAMLGNGTWARTTITHGPVLTIGSASKAKATTCHPAPSTPSMSMASGSSRTDTSLRCLRDTRLTFLNNKKTARNRSFCTSHTKPFTQISRQKKSTIKSLPTSPLVDRQAKEKLSDNKLNRPRWLLDQRNSWHGVDFPYHSELNIEQYYKRYCESLCSVDDSVGAVMDQLKKMGIHDETWSSTWATMDLCLANTG